MNNFRFIEYKEDSCLLKIDDKVWVTETLEPSLTVEIGNAIAEGKELNYDKELVNEVKEFLEANGIILDTDNQPLFYLSNNNLSFEDNLTMKTSSYNEFLNHEGIKIAVIMENSLSDIQEQIDKINKCTSPYVAILSLEDEYIISHVIKPNTPCLSCLYDRWIESHKQKYQYSQLHSNFTNSNENIEYILKEATLQLNKSSKEVKVINKYQLESQSHPIVAKESCHKCFGHVLDTSDINIKEVRTNIIDNGNRSVHPRDAIKNISIGPFSPITRIVENGDEDILKLPIFQSFIGAKPFKKTFTVHGGKGLSYYQAKMSALGEALERYNAQVHGNESMVLNSYNNISKQNKALNPELLCLDKEYPNIYNHNKKIEWILSKNITTNEECYLPANSVFFVYQPDDETLKFIPQDTTGLASGSIIEEAVYQGLCEIIERDAYAIYYRQHLEAPTIDINSIENINIRYLLDTLERENIKVHLKYLENDLGVHVVHSVTEHKSNEFPIYTHGAGASLNPNIAIQRAITESIQLRVSQQVLKKYETEMNDSENPYFTWGFGKKENVEPFLHSTGDKVIPFHTLENFCCNELSKNINIIVSNLKKNGYEVFAANLSRKDNPVKTVRVIVPGYQGTDDTLRRITDRMFKLPKMLGKSYTEKVENLNKFQIFS
ncbi:YcaO-like family protein [Niallia circulans]|uniref:YcaO-like family protein n=1 Tax=Niallia circulans TaxID=1397 RepID=A0A941GQQ4_NIACI|nr:YcaO-like family protein [Niallia circulans]MCB5237665.1 YcaO-like family protein [Niallia circulans]